MVHLPQVLEDRRVMPTPELLDRLSQLKESANAVILAHNYQWAEVQDVADFVGDSLGLSRRAAQTEAQVIVFCAVDFMAETAAILNPTRTVLLPEKTAHCPMAAMIDVQTVQEWRARYPEASVVCYVNSSAAVKAESDICCTSANVVKVVESLDNDEIVFIPDMNLGQYVSTKTEKRIHLYPGYCSTHHFLRAEQVLAAKERHPDVVVMVHPECRPEVIELADAVGSTSQMLHYSISSDRRAFLIGTEVGLLHRLKKENPDKTFISLASGLVCPNMKKTNLGSLLRALEQRQCVVRVPEEVQVRAKEALDRMLAIT